MNKTAIVFGSLLILTGVFFVVGSWAVYLLDTRIVEDGNSSFAILLNKSISESADGDSDFNLEYSFSLPDGQRLNVHRSVNKDLWSSLNVGDSLKILYNPEDPGRNFPEGSGNTSIGLSIFVSIVGGVIAAFGAIVLFGGLKSVNTKA